MSIVYKHIYIINNNNSNNNDNNIPRRQHRSQPLYLEGAASGQGDAVALQHAEE
jgi:hypothetical protein